MEMKQAYMITGTRCERCGSEGPFLLDPEDDFRLEGQMEQSTFRRTSGASISIASVPLAVLGTLAASMNGLK